MCKKIYPNSVYAIIVSRSLKKVDIRHNTTIKFNHKTIKKSIPHFAYLIGFMLKH